MLDIRYIREHPEDIKESIRLRGLKVDLDTLLDLDEKRRKLISHQEEIQAKRNSLAKESSGGKPTEAQVNLGKDLKKEFEIIEKQQQEISSTYNQLLSEVPNLIAPNTPEGGEENNRQETTWGKPGLDFDAKDHLQLDAIHDLVNFEAGAKTSGSKFYFLKEKAVRLWQAIELYAQDVVAEEGFELMMVPHIVNTEIASGTGYMPRGEENQNYVDQQQDAVMIATSEIPLTGYHKDEIIDVAEPKLYAGLSSCYRLEAGTYGKFSKGLYRTHQFEKLEMYIFCKPSESDAMLQKILQIEEKICQALEVPYQLVRIAAGDLSAPAYEKYDIESYYPAEKEYRELTSCSNCTDYQARNLNIRFRNEAGELEFVHTLNGTAAVSSRMLISVLETHQQKDGSVKIPKVLQKYYGDKIL